MIIESKTEIASGKEIAYRQVGHRKNPVIIFANGSNFNYYQFDHVYLPKIRKHLGDDYCFLFYDYVGYGRSSELDGEFDFRRVAQQQIELMDALGIENAHLFGLSKGSVISHLVAANQPDRTLSLAGYGNPNVANPEGRDFVRNYYERRLADLEEIPDLHDVRIDETNYDIVFDKIFIPSMFERDKPELNIFQRISAWFMRRKLKSMIVGPKVGYMAKLFSYYTQPVPEEEKQFFVDLVKSISVPTLLLHGEDDPYIPPSSSELLAEWNSNAQLQIIKGYRHNYPTLIPWQGSKIMNHYAEFIRSIEK